jgi:hypothetical protein
MPTMAMRTSRWCLFLLVVLASELACTGAPRQRPVKGGPVDTGAGTIASARKFLEGRWTLESFQVSPPGRSPITLTGQGTLNYDDYGNLQIEIRTDDAAADQLRAAGIDIRDNKISSSGRTVIDLQNKTLAYILEGQSAIAAPTGPLSLNRPRYWQVEGDQLTLTTKEADGTVLSVGKWKRLK